LFTQDDGISFIFICPPQGRRRQTDYLYILSAQIKFMLKICVKGKGIENIKMDKIPTFWNGELGCNALPVGVLRLKFRVGKFILTGLKNPCPHDSGLQIAEQRKG
jgi:hypothetical protein